MNNPQELYQDTVIEEPAAGADAAKAIELNQPEMCMYVPMYVYAYMCIYIYI